MPHVRVEASSGKTLEQKRGLIKDITEAVVKNFNVPPEAVSVMIQEVGNENAGKGGKLFIDS